MESVIFNLDGRDSFEKSIVTSFYNEIQEQGILDSLTRGEIKIEKFADGESSVDFQASVRGKRVYLLTSPNNSDKIMQLMLAIDAAIRASAVEIIPIIPCFPYQRSDKKDASRGPIGARMIADMLQNRGATSIITFDLHNPSIEGFFNIPVTHIEGKYLYAQYVANIANKYKDLEVVLVSPDAGASKRVKKLRDYINKKFGISLNYVIIDKVRAEANKVESMTLIGDVKGKLAIMYDDMCDTGGTAIKAGKLLKDQGATYVYFMATHGILSGDAIERIENSTIDMTVFSNSLEIPSEIRKPEWVHQLVKVKTLDCSEIIAKSIISINNAKSYETILSH